MGQALADVATIGILHQRILTHSDLTNQQLRTAPNTRVVIEQAKGVIAERGHVDLEEAFALMRSYDRSSNQRLADVARAVVDHSDTASVLAIKRSVATKATAE